MIDASHTKHFARKISDFCRLRIDKMFPPLESAAIKAFLLDLIARSVTPPRKMRSYNWDEIAIQCGLNEDAVFNARTAIEPALDAISRHVNALAVRSGNDVPSRKGAASSQLVVTRRSGSRGRPCRAAAYGLLSQNVKAEMDQKKRGAEPRIVDELPKPLFQQWVEPSSFSDALELHMRRHGDSYWHLHRAVIRDEENLNSSTIRHWMRGSKAPRSAASMEVLARIERRYRLPAGYLKAKLPHQTRSTTGYILDGVGAARGSVAGLAYRTTSTRVHAKLEEISGMGAARDHYRLDRLQAFPSGGYETTLRNPLSCNYLRTARCWQREG